MTDENESPPPAPKPRERGMLKAVFEANTRSAKDGIGKNAELPRAVVEITIDCTLCAPGVFPEDFDLTLRATTSGIEMQLAKKHRGDPTGYMFALTQASIWKVNGEFIAAGEDTFLWEALGPAGRNLAMVGYQQLSVPNEEQSKKALASLKITG